MQEVLGGLGDMDDLMGDIGDDGPEEEKKEASPY